ncbi:hypothetical protein EDB81DRAFT_770961 [Dactylonectria macrodidyma]|uniref:BCS1 N-terminal domain-containing protein n=1 Tax=Dactylonectria macrodidyma TaxID=307937 RepID=A0A9P9FR71_9HYPO|nr:hypothetical protein EDB81DRAFT_770961 [Dactylonectria macrodidyma]
MDSPENIFSKGSLAALLQTAFPGGTCMPHFAFFLFVTPYITEAFGEHIKSRFISTVEIGAQDEIYNYVMSWVARWAQQQQESFAIDQQDVVQPDESAEPVEEHYDSETDGSRNDD